MLAPVCGQSQPPEALQDEHEPPAEGVTIQWKCFPPAYPPQSAGQQPGDLGLGRTSVVAPLPVRNSRQQSQGSPVVAGNSASLALDLRLAHAGRGMRCQLRAGAPKCRHAPCLTLLVVGGRGKLREFPRPVRVRGAGAETSKRMGSKGGDASKWRR